MKHNFFKTVLMLVLCLVFGTSAAHVIVVDNSHADKNVGFKPNIDMTKYEKRTLKNGKEVYAPKHDISSKKLNADETELVNVTFLLSYDESAIHPCGDVIVNGENFSEDLRMNYDWENRTYYLTYQMPTGTFDFLSDAFIADGGMAYNIKELLQINKDTTITFDFAESNIIYNFKTFKPNGEEATIDVYEMNENWERSVVTPGNTLYFYDGISLILKGTGVVAIYDAFADGKEIGQNPSATIMINAISNRYKLASERLFQDENGMYIVKYETTDISDPCIQNNPENFVLYEDEFSSIGSDNNGLYQSFSTIEMIDNVNNGGMVGDALMSISNPVTSVYVDPNRKDGNEPSKFDIMIVPVFRDNVSEDVHYSVTIYDDDGNPMEVTGSMEVVRTLAGLPALINNDGSVEHVNAGHDVAGDFGFHIPEGGGDIVEYPGHPRFSYASQQKALSYGSSCPITAFMAKNTEGVDMEGKYSYLSPCFIGRYGEIISGAYATDIRYNDNNICDNCLLLPDLMYLFAAQGNPDGVMTAHFENTNTVVDGLQGKNTTDIYFDQRQEDWTAPTLQMLLFKDRDGNIIDRFATAEEGTLEFAGGDFNYIVDMNTYYSWFNCKEQTVEVFYSPYCADQWLPLEVNEVPSEFFMPGFGYFYRGSLQSVTNGSQTGWYDLMVKLTDASGNWQQQVISPAFRIGSGSPTAIETVNNDDATEVARYTVDGRAISAPQAGVNIVKMSDGTVKKVLVK